MYGFGKSAVILDHTVAVNLRENDSRYLIAQKRTESIE